MRRRRRCFNSQSLRLRNYIIFTANRSPSLPQLSHNSRTSLSLLSISSGCHLRDEYVFPYVWYSCDTMVTSTYVRTYVRTCSRQNVRIITTFPGWYNSLSFKYGGNTTQGGVNEATGASHFGYRLQEVTPASGSRIRIWLILSCLALLAF